MQAALHDRDQFAPPRPPGRMRAIALAVLAHAVLVGALTWGVNWKSSSDQSAVEAELWAAVPQQAAPRAEAPPPPPAPAPAPEPKPTPAPPPPPPPPPRQAEPDQREADIALEREKKRQEELKKKRELQQERDKRERERKEEERRERLEQDKKERQLAQQKAEREKAEKAEKAEQEKAKKLAEDKRRKAEEAREAKEADARHQANVRRMQGLAGATGGETATGTAQRYAGPSGGYGGKVAAKVKPNIVFPDQVDGNPRAEVEVRAAPDGTIVGTRITHSSGNKAWDVAVIRALQRTETLPRDVDGRVPPSFVIVFRPKD